MAKQFFWFTSILVIFSLGALFAAENEEIAYVVVFPGVENQEMLKLLREASQLVALQTRPPSSEISLRRRAALDIPNLVKALHSKAHYNARVNFVIDFKKTPAVVTFTIEPGPVYPLASFVIYPEWLKIPLKKIGICLNKPALPADIISAEENLITFLDKKGYPLAKIIDREVIADQKTKRIHVNLTSDPGPLAYFGKVEIKGNKEVKDLFIKRKIYWKEGEVYSPCKVEKTLNALESAGVFSEISITHAEEVDSQNRLPFTINVEEGKRHSIGLGVGYSTQRGPGFTGEWESRNFRGMGEKLRVEANVLTETQEGSVSYLIPDYRTRGQDLIWAAELEHDDTKGYEKTSFSVSGALEKQLTKDLRVSYGAMYEYLKNTNEKKDGDKETEIYNLTRIPLKLRWSTADDALDPTKGATVFVKTVPTFQFIDHSFLYSITTLSASIYKPCSKEKRLILAARAQLGSIWGASRETIPGSDRFYAGSENTLRGYNYLTVSPLSADGDPIGGRSLMVYSLESRFKVRENWGVVFFYDIGNVFAEPFPQFNKKMLQSVGIGLRYYTPVGPLRLDVAFPLNRRRAFDKKANKTKTIDRPYQIYFSVGQSF